MPQQLIDTLILSMGRRCETCLAVRGDHIPTKDRMFLAGHPSQGCFGLLSHCAPCYFFDKASFYPSDFSFMVLKIRSEERPLPIKFAEVHTSFILAGRRVAGQVDRSECAFRNCWEQWTREGTHARKTGSGATRKTTRRDDRRIVRQALVDSTVTRSTIRADVGVSIVPQTISRHLAEANLKSKRPFRALPLTPRRPGERYSSPHTVLRHTARTTGVMVWGAIAYDSRSTLIVMRGTLTGQRCVDDVLQPHVGPFLNGLPGAIFQQDNARSHTARVAQDFLHHFQTLPWPAVSLNLSPVEHVRDQLKLQMPSCHSVHDLELAVQDLWAHLPQGNIKGV
ncbi:transposable element Tcb1 transposase [Trichonephila clavipes]|nr:transposable element Tcb1 transposase [Trichonephila clavipes]